MLYHTCATHEEITTLYRRKGAIEVEPELYGCTGVWLDGYSIVFDSNIR